MSQPEAPRLERSGLVSHLVLKSWASRPPPERLNTLVPYSYTLHFSVAHSQLKHRYLAERIFLKPRPSPPPDRRLRTRTLATSVPLETTILMPRLARYYASLEFYRVQTFTTSFICAFSPALKNSKHKDQEYADECWREKYNPPKQLFRRRRSCDPVTYPLQVCQKCRSDLDGKVWFEAAVQDRKLLGPHKKMEIFRCMPAKSCHVVDFYGNDMSALMFNTME